MGEAFSEDDSITNKLLIFSLQDLLVNEMYKNDSENTSM